MLIILIQAFVLIITFTLLVGVHEFGHFAAARLLGVKVLRFALGFGKALYIKRDNKTNIEYTINLLPLGGYVRLLDEREGEVSDKDKPYAFNRQSLAKRFAIVFAGPVSSFLFAFFIFWLIFSVGMFQVVPTIGEVVRNSSAAKAQLKSGDEIVAVNDAAVTSWQKILLHIIPHLGKTKYIQLTVRGPKSQTLSVKQLVITELILNKLQPDILGSLGIVPYQGPLTHVMLKKQQAVWYFAWLPAWFEAWDLGRFNLILIQKMLVGIIPWQSLGGPISLFEGAVMSVEQGILAYLYFLAFVSIGLAVLNSLPIPGLDGGHLFYFLIELIIKRPVPEKIQLLVFRLSVILMFLLIMQVFLHDLQRLG